MVHQFGLGVSWMPTVLVGIDHSYISPKVLSGHVPRDATVVGLVEPKNGPKLNYTQLVVLVHEAEGDGSINRAVLERRHNLSGDLLISVFTNIREDKQTGSIQEPCKVIYNVERM